MGLKHWILPKDRFNFWVEDPSQLGSWSKRRFSSFIFFPLRRLVENSTIFFVFLTPSLIPSKTCIIASGL